MFPDRVSSVVAREAWKRGAGRGSCFALLFAMVTALQASPSTPTPTAPHSPLHTPTPALLPTRPLVNLGQAGRYTPGVSVQPPDQKEGRLSNESYSGFSAYLLYLLIYCLQ